MELLTDRLCVVIKEMADNLMSDLIMKHNSECLKIVKPDDEESMYCYQRKRFSPVEDKNQKIIQESERQNKLNALSSIWGASRHLKGKTTNQNKEVKDRKCDNKFLKAAKILVVINLLKQGSNICTCNSLDSKCKRHDS